MLESRVKTVLLDGAPQPSSLRWEEAELSAPLQPAFANHAEANNLETSTMANVGPSWRSLPIERVHLPTGLTQAGKENLSFEGFANATSATSFLSTADLSLVFTNTDTCETQGSLALDPANTDILSQYYEHSLAVHEDIPTSQIVGPCSLEDASFMTEPEESSLALTANSETDSRGYLTLSRLANGQLNDLKDIPNAAHLHSITPQTMTVNLVLGIISVSQPRMITTRRDARSVELVEILVGDDTKTGFGINIWLPCSQESNHILPRNEDLRSEVLEVRPRDIVLAKQVALTSFKGRVYGQSLRRGMTTLDLLYRNVVDSEDRRGAFRARDLENIAKDDPHIHKVKRVKDWVVRFVGATTAPPPSKRQKASHLGKERQPQALPNDTP